MPCVRCDVSLDRIALFTFCVMPYVTAKCHISGVAHPGGVTTPKLELGWDFCAMHVPLSFTIPCLLVRKLSCWHINPVGQTLLRVITQRGLPQGRGLSPTLWSLVADSLLKWLTKQGVFAQGFADDGVIVITGKVLNTIREIMQRILCGVEKWCTDRELSVNPSKTETMLFTRKYKPDALGTIFFYEKELELTTQVKYLGSFLTQNLINLIGDCKMR